MVGFRAVVYDLRLGELMSVSVARIYSWFSLKKKRQIFSHFFRDSCFLCILFLSFVPAYDTIARLTYFIGGFLRETLSAVTRQDIARHRRTSRRQECVAIRELRPLCNLKHRQNVAPRKPTTARTRDSNTNTARSLHS